MFQCANCLNISHDFFSFNNGKIYCRKCISFIGERVNRNEHQLKEVSLNLNYSLSVSQQEISDNILKAYKNKKNVLIKAVCGAGKTELVYQVILYALKLNLQVGFAIPRKDVVIDLYPRLKEAFPHQKVSSVYGNHHSDLTGDIILLTTHQLYRYENYFDLLIIDEIDAFPYHDNEILQNMFLKAIKGNFVMMSATADEDLIKKIKMNNGEVFNLDKRYHNHPLPVPKIKTFLFGKYFYLILTLLKLSKNNLPTLIFVPTIEECERLYKKCCFIPNGNFVHSKVKEREIIIEGFKKGKYQYLITTSILERGVTIKNSQVIIFDAHSHIYDKKTLIQIAGRVGRKIDAYDGEVIFIGEYYTKEMQDAVDEIKRANKS